MNDERLGIVPLDLADGRSIPLRFTWARIDAVGRDWIVTRLQSVIEGKTGCQAALAELIVLASGGAITAADLFDEDKPVLPFEVSSEALLNAWTLARFGPSGKAAGQPSDPQKSPKTQSNRPWKWHWVSGSTKTGSGDQRPT